MCNSLEHFTLNFSTLISQNRLSMIERESANISAQSSLLSVIRTSMTLQSLKNINFYKFVHRTWHCKVYIWTWAILRKKSLYERIFILQVRSFWPLRFFVCIGGAFNDVYGPPPPSFQVLMITESLVFASWMTI